MIETRKVRLEKVMEVDIDVLTYEELVELNYKVSERLQLLAHKRAESNRVKFRIDDEVSFQPPNRELITGVISEITRDIITVVTKGDHSWNVEPCFLEKSDHG